MHSCVRLLRQVRGMKMPGRTATAVCVGVIGIAALALAQRGADGQQADWWAQHPPPPPEIPRIHDRDVSVSVFPTGDSEDQHTLTVSDGVSLGKATHEFCIKMFAASDNLGACCAIDLVLLLLFCLSNNLVNARPAVRDCAQVLLDGMRSERKLHSQPVHSAVQASLDDVARLSRAASSRLVPSMEAWGDWGHYWGAPEEELRLRLLDEASWNGNSPPELLEAVLSAQDGTLISSLASR